MYYVLFRYKNTRNVCILNPKKYCIFHQQITALRLLFQKVSFFLTAHIFYLINKG